MSVNVSRRSFTAGSAAAFAAGAIATAGTVSAPAPAAAAAEGSGWLGKPGLVAEDQIGETVDVDVLIIGGGLSGMSAFASAAEEGVKTLLIEKHKTSRYGGIFHSAVGYQDQIDAGCILDPEEVLRDELVKNGPICNPAHWATWAYNSGKIADWELRILKEHGVVTFLPFTGYAEGDEDIANEPFATVPGSYVTCWDVYVEEGREATKKEIEALKDAGEQAGGEVRFNTAGMYLEQDESGAVTGAIASGENGFVRINAAKGVIMCTGDFAGNLDMCKALLPEGVAQGIYDFNAYCGFMYDEDRPEPGVRLDTGDGHRMCIWAGGKMEDNASATMGWPAEAVYGVFGCLGLDASGRRFCNEAFSLFTIGRMAYDRPGAEKYGTHFFKILDADYAQQTAEMRNYCLFGQAALAEGQLDGEYHADTLAGLAELMGVDPEVLEAEVDRYNELCEAGVDYDFGKPAHYLFPIKNPPFYAAKTNQILYHTVGGVICSKDCEVMGADGPIPGLYAAGNVVGQRFGDCYEVSLPGASNAFALVHGYLSAKHAAAR